MLLGYGTGVCWFISVNHLSNANVLVFSHVRFSISLLGFDSLYMGHHFLVQVTCRLQDLSMGGLGVEDSAFVICFVDYM